MDGEAWELNPGAPCMGVGDADHSATTTLKLKGKIIITPKQSEIRYWIVCLGIDRETIKNNNLITKYVHSIKK